MLKVSMIACIILFFSIMGFSQEFKLKGEIVDTRGEPLKNIYVTSLSNHKKSKVSNYKGIFTLKVMVGDTLVMIGSDESIFKIVISNQTNKKFVLHSSDEKILNDEQTLTLIENKDKEWYRDIINRYKKANIHVYYNTIFDMINAEHPNVSVSEGSGTVQIMGMKNNAMIVIDGVKGADLRNVNPLDVASIKVIKDATAGMYGGGATGGVVEIKTKRSDNK